MSPPLQKRPLPFALALVAAGVLAACGGSNTPEDAAEPGSTQSILAASQNADDEDEAVDGMPSDAVPNDEPAQNVPDAAAVGQSSVEMSKYSTWATGYCARVYVTNTADSPLAWKVTVPVVGAVTRAWNATWSAAAGRLTAQGAKYNLELAPGETTDFGFCADTNAASAPPPPPPPDPTPAPPAAAGKAPLVEFLTPTANRTVNPGYQLGSLVKATDDGSVATVTLYIDDRAIRTERAAPYTFGRESPNNKTELEGLKAGTYTIRAVATDNSGQRSEDKFTLTVTDSGNPGGACTLNTPAPGIPPGITLFTVKSKSTARPNFCSVDKWYDESANKQVFSLYSGDNFTNFNPTGRSHARTEASGGQNFTRAENQWREFEATMLFNTKPTKGNGAVTMAQIFAGCCGPVLRIEITESGNLRWGSTADGGGVFSEGNESYAGKPFKVKLRSNGSRVEAYMDGKLRYSGAIRRYSGDSNALYHFRWGVYSKTPKETLTNTVTNVTRK